jgi:hypothetical protein
VSVLQRLDAEEMYLAALLDDTTGIDLAEFSFTDETPGRPDPCYRVQEHQWAWWGSEEPYEIDHCIAAGSMVLTSRGHVPIEDVQIGDLVLTHKNRWRPVTARWDRGIRPVVRVKANGLSEGLRVTPEHQLLGRLLRRKTAFESPAWVRVDALETRPDRHHKLASPGSVEPIALPEIGPIHAPGRRNDLVASHLLRAEFWWLVGLCAAEGSYSSSYGTGGKLNRTTFSVHEDEVPEVSAVLDALGFNHRVEVTPTRCSNVIVNSQSLTTYLRALVGSGARNKILNPCLFGLSEAMRLSLLHGLLFGDGHDRGDGGCDYTTTSPRLARDVKILASTLGMFASVAHRDAPKKAVFIRGRRIYPGDSYVTYVRVLRAQRVSSWSEDGHQWGRTVSVIPDGEARVYDIEVAEDHSFVVEGVVSSNCSRDVGKSESIIARAAAFVFAFPGQEMLLTAPELNHLAPITGRVEAKFLSGPRLLRSMLPRQKGGGIKHQPQFEMLAINKARIVGRLPNRDGKGVKGIHAIRVELDEGQDYPVAGYTEITESFRASLPGAQFRVHGVTRGVRDTYFRYTQPDSGLPFFVHRYQAMHRPTWNAEERKNKIAFYGGSRDNLDYRRNIHGDHGDASSRLFVLARLMGCVATPGQSTWADTYNDDVYNCIKVTGERIEAGEPVESFINLSRTHLLKEYTSYWAGADIGFTNDPTEILVFGMTSVTRGGLKVDLMRLLTRIHLMRVSAADQEKVFEKVFEFYGDRLKAMSLDKTGAGLPIYQHMIGRAGIASRVKGYGFSEKRPVMMDDRELLEGERPEDLVITKSVVEFASDKLREYVDSKMIELPYDQELLTEWQGQTISYSSDGGSTPRARYSGGSLHTLDAAKVMILGKELEAMEEMARRRPVQAPILDVFGF